jgi:hypothetical protein
VNDWLARISTDVQGLEATYAEKKHALDGYRRQVLSRLLAAGSAGHPATADDAVHGVGTMKI